MIKNKIAPILYETKWHENISLSFSEEISEKVDDLCKRISMVSREIEFLDKGNPSICFIREMQFSLHQSAALIGISLYKASVGSLRTFVESFLYYSYFRNHHEEFRTLLNNSKYYISKNEILDHHKIHNVDYSKRNGILSFENKLNEWYSKSSAIVHGQIPGTWNTHSSLLEINFSKNLMMKAMENFETSVSIVLLALLATIDDESWHSLTFESKKIITKGIVKKKLVDSNRTII